ncbi:MAG: Gfo/Idh/MocA family protein [Jatrophihabitans sp.]|uniref:Gfo/Idh/MocA family protein n=1 Tax=Jatrophihabitans sp. TaxID=1932789 RepID=UPI003F810AE9
MIRWGVLGAGGIASTVGADIAASADSEIVAVGARDVGRARAFADARGIPRAYGSYAELVADPDVDVVYVATTHAQHHEHALLALRAGKPVLVEKAFTLNAGEAREVVAEARARGLFCMEALWTRLNPTIQQAVQLAGSGRIGDVVAVRADLSKLFPYDPGHRLYDPAAGGGALLDLGVYPVTLATLFLGRPDRIEAMGTLAPTGTDVTVLQQWHYDDGRLAQLYCSAAGPSPFGALVNGTDGWIGIEPRMHRPQRLVVQSGDEQEVIPAVPSPGNGYRFQVAEVERCLREGLLESPAIPLDDTVMIMEILDEVRRQLGVRYPADDAPSEDG